MILVREREEIVSSRAERKRAGKKREEKREKRDLRLLIPTLFLKNAGSGQGRGAPAPMSSIDELPRKTHQERHGARKVSGPTPGETNYKPGEVR